MGSQSGNLRNIIASKIRSLETKEKWLFTVIFWYKHFWDSFFGVVSKMCSKWQCSKAVFSSAGQRPGSYCYVGLSVLRACIRALTLCFKWYLLWNHLDNFDRLHINDPWMVLCQNCSNEVDPCRTLVAMATKSKNSNNRHLRTNWQIWL